jgi:hypothetical protein
MIFSTFNGAGSSISKSNTGDAALDIGQLHDQTYRKLVFTLVKGATENRSINNYRLGRLRTSRNRPPTTPVSKIAPNRTSAQDLVEVADKEPVAGQASSLAFLNKSMVTQQHLRNAPDREALRRRLQSISKLSRLARHRE